MAHSQYLIIGGGMTADAAARGIRDIDPRGSIVIVSAEQVPPYERPPLSKKLWTGKSLESIGLGTERVGGVTLHCGRRVQSLNLGDKSAVDDRGDTWTFDRLLIATGATPRRLPGGDGVIYFRTVEDYRRLRALTERREQFAVIGDGFIGSEIAAALAMNGKKVQWIFPSETPCHRLFPRDLGNFLIQHYRERGVEVLAGESVTGVEKRGDRLSVWTRISGTHGERQHVVDGVIAGIGVSPAVELARGAGLEVANGILVDRFLRTAHPDIYAAGDVALFPDALLDKHRRVEHEDNAYAMGRIAGHAMAGEFAPYEHSPFFYSDLFDFGYEAVGELAPGKEMVVDWKEPNREGVIYYLRDQRVRGVLLWNVWGRVDAARRLIEEPGPFSPSDLRGRIRA